MSLFKKPNRKFRQRVTRTESEEEDEIGEACETKEKKSNKLDAKEKIKSGNTSELKEKNISVSSTNAPSLILREGTCKDKDEKSDLPIKTRKLLSFHDEEDDGEVFKLKKSNYSRRLAKQLEKERKKRQENPNTVTTDEPQDAKSVSKQDAEVKLEQGKQSKEGWDILTGKEAEDMDVDSDEEKDSQIENPFKNVLQSGIIPDAATIYAMKKHRQMAREMSDFIPIEEPPEKTEENKSRLIREDDHDRSDDDDDDEPSRLNFTVNTGAVERQKVREAFLLLQDGSQEELENEEAAELERWEREQIRKGVSVAQVAQPQTQPLPENPFYQYQPPGVEERPYYGAISTKEHNANISAQPFVGGFPKNNDADLTTGSIKARLDERLSSLKELHKAHEQELEACQKELVDATSLILKLEEEGPELAQRFSLYQQMRGYIRDLVECLDLKVAHIEVLDSNMMDLYKLRSKKLISRRQQDIRDQADEYSLLSSKILKGSSSEIASEKNGCSDETKLRRAAEREGRRMRRRKSRERNVLSIKHHEGMSSDDEEPDIDIIKFRQKKENLLYEANIVFEDVVDEFGTLAGVMTNFEKWKSEQLESYCEAFVPLCLPKIFGPFVRVELLHWNPLEDTEDLETMKWFQSLTFYGWNESMEKVIPDKDDPDINLLPGIMEKIVLPKITEFVENVWDPMSTKETLKLVHLTRKLYEDYPSVNGKSKQVQKLLQAVSTRILKSLDDDVFIPLYPKELLENRSLGSSVFFQRQFWSSVKLLNNILSWDGVIAEQPLQDMALSSLLNRYVLMGLHTSMVMKDTFEKCKAIIASFPKRWLTNVKGNNSLSHLKQFSQYLVKYAQSFQSQNTKRNAMDDETKDIIKEIIQLLVTIGSLDEAVTLAKQFSISGIKK